MRRPSVMARRVAVASVSLAVAAGALLLVDDSARAFLSGCWPKQHEQNAGWQDAQERRSEQSSHSNLHRPGGNKPR